MTKCAYGFLLKNGRIELKGMTVESETDFAVVALSSLTEDSIAHADNLLLTTVGRAQNTDAKFEGDLMLDYGKPPVLVEVIKATIEIETDVEYGCTSGSDHTWKETTITEATCTLPKYQNYKCSVCQAEKSEPIGAPTGHDYEDPQTFSPTCTTPGYAIHECKVCGHTYTEETDPATGHDWSDAIFDVVGAFEPTCTTPGKAAYVCDTCGEEKFDSVPVLGHEYGDGVVTPPTCTEDGYTTKTCTRCGYSYVVSGSRKEALGHDWEEYSDPSASSGLSRRCRVCELVEEDI
jgi:rubredoxin